VEASLIFPVVIAVFVIAIYGGIQLYEEECKTVVSIEEEREIDIIPIFYRWKGLEELETGEG
jgi:hypothetical protein